MTYIVYIKGVNSPLKFLSSINSFYKYIYRMYSPISENVCTNTDDMHSLERPVALRTLTGGDNDNTVYVTAVRHHHACVISKFLTDDTRVRQLTEHSRRRN